MAANDITVNIIASTKRFTDGLNKSTKSLQSFSKRAKNFVIANKLAITAAIASIGVLTFKVIKAASDLEETQAKFNTVFRGVSEEAEKSAQILQESFLLSETAAKANLAAIQDTLVPMGLMRDEAQNISFEVVKLAADLGSFNNLPTEQVMRDIQSALVGNFETMKKYGVVLRATDVTNRILNKGLANSASEITNAQRVTEAYNLILEGTEDAQGDVARTSDSFANRMKELSSATTDLSANLGKFLLGEGTTFLTWLNKVVKASNAWIKVRSESLSVQEENIKKQKEEIAEFNITLEKLRRMGNENGKIATQIKADIELRLRNIMAARRLIRLGKEGVKEEKENSEKRVKIIRLETQFDLIKKDERIQAAIKEGAQRNAIQEFVAENFMATTKKWTNFAAAASGQVFDQFGAGVADMILDGRKFSDVMKNIWKDLARQIIAQIARMIAKWLIFNALTTGPSRGLLSFFQHGGVISEPSLITGLRSGQQAIAGEAGPEAVVPLSGSGSGGGIQPTPPGVAGQLAGVNQGSSGGVNLTVNISGNFIEASPAKWAMMFREKILPEIRRFTMIAPTSPFTRRRGAA